MSVINFDHAQWYIIIGDLRVPVQRVAHNWESSGNASARPLRTEVTGILVPEARADDAESPAG